MRFCVERLGAFNCAIQTVALRRAIARWVRKVAADASVRRSGTPR